MLLALLVALLLAACEQGEIDRGPVRPEPDDPPTGTLIDELTIDDTTFRLYDEGGGCLAVGIDQPGLQRTVDRGCFSGERVVGKTEPCGWLEERDDEYPAGCDVQLPEVVYGQVRDPQIGHVCLGIIRDGGMGVIDSARFVTIGDGGFIFEPALPGESGVGHLFTPGGTRYGQPPLDAPSNPIYTYCEGLAPWGEPESALFVELYVELGSDLRRDDVIVLLDGGSGVFGIAGNASSPPLDLPMEVPESSQGLEIQIEAPLEAARNPLVLPWPDQIAEMLQDGRPCQGPIRIRVVIPDEALSGSDDAIALSVMSIQCEPTSAIHPALLDMRLEYSGGFLEPGWIEISGDTTYEGEFDQGDGLEPRSGTVEGMAFDRLDAEVQLAPVAELPDSLQSSNGCNAITDGVDWTFTFELTDGSTHILSTCDVEFDGSHPLFEAAFDLLALTDVADGHLVGLWREFDPPLAGSTQLWWMFSAITDPDERAEWRQRIYETVLSVPGVLTIESLDLDEARRLSEYLSGADGFVTDSQFATPFVVATRGSDVSGESIADALEGLGTIDDAVSVP